MLKLFRTTAALVAFIAPTLTSALSGHQALAQTTRSRPHIRSSHQGAAATPLLTGTDGSQTGVAKFQGNYTVITAPSGQVLALSRGANCSLLFLTGTYSNGSTFSYSSTGMTPNYERTLHTEAGLTTTADSAPAGCVDPTRGIGARPAAFVGKTTMGVNVYAGVFYNFLTQVQALYVLTGESVFTDTVLNFSAAGLIATADLNGDGNGDLIVVNGVNGFSSSSTGMIYVLLGKADGTFSTAVPYTIAGGNSLTAVIDDFNGDGKLDIVATSSTGQISLLTGNGDGSFNTAQSFTPPTPVYPGSTATTLATIYNLVSADLRSTGHKDLIASNGLVLLNDGTGNFTATTNAAFPTLQPPSQGGPYLATGDINRDGHPDLVVSSASGLTTYIGKGDGTFTPGIGYATINSDGFISVTDLDGDGNPDIYVGDANGGLFRGDSSDTNIAYALMGNGDGTFSGAPTAPGSYNGTNLGDVNGDGQQDLITAANSTTYTVLLGTSKGTFNPVSTVPPPPATIPVPNPISFGPITIVTGSVTTGTTYAVADVNGDGKADLVYLIYNPTEINPVTNQPQEYTGILYFVSLSNGDGTFKSPVPYLLPQIAPPSSFDEGLTADSLHIGDFNHDGKADLIFNFSDFVNGGNYLEGFIVLPGNGDGTFGSAIITYTYNSPTAPPSNSTTYLPLISAAADLTGDNIPDLVTYSTSFAVTNGVGAITAINQVMVGNGDGTFKAPTTVFSSNRLGSLTVGDFNKDGHADLAALGEITDTEQGQLFIALSNGNGTFQTTTLLLGGGDTVPDSGLTAADFDGDGNVDLAYLNAESFSGIFYGKGDGTFTSVPIGNGMVSPKDLVNLFIGSSSGTIALDLNKDGHPDILNGNAALLSLYGSATTPPPTLVGTTTTLTASATSIAAGASVTLTATVTPVSGATAPTGTITFLDGTTALSTVTLASNTATYTTTTLAAGSHSITAVYSGDTDFSTSTSSILSITVTTPPPPPADFSIALSSATATVPRSSSITNTVTITPTNGFNQAVTLTCTGAPTNSTCTLLPTSVTPNGTAPITSTLTFTADVPATALNRTHHDFEVAAVLPLGLLSTAALFTLGRRRRVRLSKIRWPLQLLALSTISLLLAATGCGGHHSSSSTTTTVNTTTALTASANSIVAGGSITFTATVTGASGSTGTPTGTVNFLDGNTTLGTGTLASGTASFTTTTLASGSHTITAVYSGQTLFSSSTSAAVVIAVGTTNTPTPGTYPLTVTATSGATTHSTTYTVTIQ